MKGLELCKSLEFIPPRALWPFFAAGRDWMGSFLWKRSHPPQDTGSGSGEARTLLPCSDNEPELSQTSLFLFAVPPSSETALSSLAGWSFSLAKCCIGWVFRNETAEEHQMMQDMWLKYLEVAP